MFEFFDWMMLAILLWSGGYALYSAIRLKREYYLFENRFLYPGNCPPDKCVDVNGFIEFIFPRVLLLGVVCLVLGALFGICTFTDWLPTTTWFSSLAMPISGVLIFIWYMFVQRRAANRFW